MRLGPLYWIQQGTGRSSFPSGIIQRSPTRQRDDDNNDDPPLPMRRYLDTPKFFREAHDGVGCGRDLVAMVNQGIPEILSDVVRETTQPLGERRQE